MGGAAALDHQLAHTAAEQISAEPAEVYLLAGIDHCRHIPEPTTRVGAVGAGAVDELFGVAREEIGARVQLSAAGERDLHLAGLFAAR
jgi:hypothetical protein